jgi:hypothetical protein
MAKIRHMSSLDVKTLSRDVSSSSRNYQAVEARLELLKYTGSSAVQLAKAKCAGRTPAKAFLVSAAAWN